MSFVTRSCISPNNRVQVGSSCSLQLSKSPYVPHSHIVAAPKRPKPRTYPYVPRYVQPFGAYFWNRSSFFFTHAWNSRTRPSFRLKLVMYNMAPPRGPIHPRVDNGWRGSHDVPPIGRLCGAERSSTPIRWDVSMALTLDMGIH